MASKLRFAVKPVVMHQNVLTLDHRLDIVTEDHLGIGIELWLYHIDGLVAIDAPEAALGQLVGKASTDHMGTI